jgi:hypothetical protein
MILQKKITGKFYHRYFLKSTQKIFLTKALGYGIIEPQIEKTEEQEMLYEEFVKGTGCKPTEKNYKVYKDLEVMYMNSDKTKEEIYEYGKKLVDNSKSEEQIRLENEIKAEIKSARNRIKTYTENAKYYEAIAKSETDSVWKKDYKGYARQERENARQERSKIRELKFILGTM